MKVGRFELIQDPHLITSKAVRGDKPVSSASAEMQELFIYLFDCSRVSTTEGLQQQVLQPYLNYEVDPGGKKWRSTRQQTTEPALPTFAWAF